MYNNNQPNFEEKIMLENLKPIHKIGSCKVRTYYETLEPSDAKLLRQYVDDVDGWNSWALSKALRNKDVILDSKVITRHRDKHCTCRLLDA
jgi:hypothetical protein